MITAVPPRLPQPAPPGAVTPPGAGSAPVVCRRGLSPATAAAPRSRPTSPGMPDRLRSGGSGRPSCRDRAGMRGPDRLWEPAPSGEAPPPPGPPVAGMGDGRLWEPAPSGEAAVRQSPGSAAIFWSRGLRPIGADLSVPGPPRVILSRRRRISAPGGLPWATAGLPGRRKIPSVASSIAGEPQVGAAPRGRPAPPPPGPPVVGMRGPDRLWEPAPSGEAPPPPGPPVAGMGDGRLWEPAPSGEAAPPPRAKSSRDAARNRGDHPAPSSPAR